MNIRKHQSSDAYAIITLYRECFSGPPWNHPVSINEATKRWQEHSNMPGFNCFVATIKGEIVGSSWYNIISIDELEKERGKEIASFIDSIPTFNSYIWIRETIVALKHQGKAIATRLKQHVMDEIAQHHAPVILITRMRDDNTKIIRANEKLQFQRTDIKVKSSSLPGVEHEYWYRTLHPKSPL